MTKCNFFIQPRKFFFALTAATAALLLQTGCGTEKLDIGCIPFDQSDCPEGESGCFSDGCGGYIDCGGCLIESDAGSDGGVEIKDGGGGLTDACIPKTCDETDACGNAIDDGCGGKLECGCSAPNACVSGHCSCTPLTCGDLGSPNGEAYDGCGGFIQCSGSGSAAENIRIITANLTSTGTMNLSDGTSTTFSETWDPGPGKRILRGLKPAIALLQETKILFYDKDRTGFWRNSDSSLRDFVVENFGSRFYAYREDRTGKSLGKPNSIISYYPIKQAGQFPSSQENIGDRQHVWARIDIPGKRDLWVFSIHMTTGTNSAYGSEASQRSNEMRGLIQNIKSLNIPSGDYLVIGGDFNTSTRSEACLDALDSSGLVYIDTESDCPIDQSRNGDTNAARRMPYDMILTSSALKNYLVKPVIGSASNLTKRGVVIDTRKFTPISAISPALSSDSGSTDMQHMAVLKEFAVPR